MSQEPGASIESLAKINFKPTDKISENVSQSIIFTSESDKPHVVKTDPETGRVTAVGDTLEEMNNRQKKLNETPKSIADPETGAQAVNPAWLEAKAEALGLTLDEYQKLVSEGVEDVGEYVAKTGRTEEEIKSYADMMVGKNLKKNEEEKENKESQKKPLGENQEKRWKLAYEWIRKTEEMAVKAGGTIDATFDPSKLSNEPLSPQEEEEYKKLVKERDIDEILKKFS